MSVCGDCYDNVFEANVDWVNEDSSIENRASSKRVENAVAEKDLVIAKKDLVIAEKDLVIAAMTARIATLEAAAPPPTDEFDSMSMSEMSTHVEDNDLPCKTGKGKDEFKKFIRKATLAKDIFDNVVPGSEDDTLKKEIVTKVKAMDVKRMRQEIQLCEFPLRKDIKRGEALRALPIWMYYMEMSEQHGGG
jgi:hypothetical protein